MDDGNEPSVRLTVDDDLSVNSINDVELSRVSG